MSKCLCSGAPYDGCGQTFKSLTGFDTHRVGKLQNNTRRCMTIDELTAAGMVLTDGVWAKPISPDKIARLKRHQSPHLRARKAVGDQTGIPTPLSQKIAV